MSRTFTEFLKKSMKRAQQTNRKTGNINEQVKQREKKNTTEGVPLVAQWK